MENVSIPLVENVLIPQKKTYILDASILTVSPYAIFAFDEHDVVIVDVTLDELNRKKLKSGEAGSNAMEAIRILNEFQKTGSLRDGVPLPGGGTLKIKFFWVDNTTEYLPAHWDKNAPDNQILTVCIALSQRGEYPILVSNDVSFRIKAGLVSIPAEEYRTEQVGRPSEQYRGRQTIYVAPEAINSFYQQHRLTVSDIIAYDTPDNDVNDIELTPNEFFLIVDIQDEKHTALGRFNGKEIVPLVFDKREPYGVRPRNIGQKFAQEALMTSYEQAPLVILKGPAGTAKTFYSLACGLESVLNKGEMKRILVSRPNIKFDEDIGYLKGSEEEKIGPLIRPVFDNLETLTKVDGRKNDEYEYGSYAQDLFSSGKVVAQALAYMRGRSITDTWVIIDEAQNMSPMQAFGIVSRAGLGSKVILAGDPDQIDDPKLDRRTNGLVYASERMRGSPLCWQVTFSDKECVRSKLALEAISRMSPKGYQGRL